MSSFNFSISPPKNPIHPPACNKPNISNFSKICAKGK